MALASLPNFTLPGDISASNRYYAEDIAEPLFALNPDSTLSVPTAPGLGVTVNEKALEKFTEHERDFWTRMNMHLDVAVAKTRKYATPESGDTIEMIERPGGGLSFVVVDGQRSGKSAKAISNIVARKAVTLLAEGVRDGAAARAAHDYLYTHRSGKVSATLNIVSVDLESRTLVLSRNNHCPTIVSLNGELQIVRRAVAARRRAARHQARHSRDCPSRRKQLW